MRGADGLRPKRLPVAARSARRADVALQSGTAVRRAAGTSVAAVAAEREVTSGASGAGAVPSGCAAAPAVATRTALTALTARAADPGATGSTRPTYRALGGYRS
ncbi:hypothetical protein [Mycobacterium marinum]|uniref:hypothetical protein n=1 Tax=Mycobacterium marinum TaxID=1781 RepID=UPI0035676D98